MSQQKGALISQIILGSPADQLGLKSEDILLAVNEQPLQDLIDYQYLTADENIRLDILHPNGSQEVVTVSKEYDSDLGIRFEHAVFDGTRHCRNRCCFCFVEQLPSGLRSSLYVRDDDYRLSFLQGNFVTLTNLRHGDLERILKWHLSPLYISVHTTDPKLRKQMMANPYADQILNQLQQLANGGITLHVQIVLCPGINDGQHLERTIRELGELGPNLGSVGIVPVGLTKFREQLFGLRSFTSSEARECIAQVQAWQTFFMEQRGSRLVYLSDEFYLVGEVDFPLQTEYEDFFQLENGVGLARLFLDEFEQLSSQLPAALDAFQKVVVITSHLGWEILDRVSSRFEGVGNLAVKLLRVNNCFFGEKITVTGLLTGQDIFNTLSKALAEIPDRVVIPEVMLKAGTTLFLDDWSVEDLEKRLGIQVKIASTSARGLLEAVLDCRLNRRTRRLRISKNR
jgi:putative radical SAM enzyme (TIGR03279 family)